MSSLTADLEDGARVLLDELYKAPNGINPYDEGYVSKMVEPLITRGFAMYDNEKLVITEEGKRAVELQD